jgi:hypothetical protein
VEAALYTVAGALVAPPASALPDAATGAYRPFDVLEQVRARIALDGRWVDLVLQPLLILDDAHALHPAQFEGVQRWLARRELRIGRWMLTRLDILPARDVLQRPVASVEDESPALMGSRDVLPIALQSNVVERRKSNRATFRRMAQDMAGRYLRRMPLFERKGYRQLESLLGTDEPTLPKSRLEELRSSVDAAQKRLKVSARRRVELEAEIARYAESTKGPKISPDVGLAMLSIMMHRYANRVPQASLFDGDESSGGPDPSRPVRAGRDVAEGARLHLLHAHDRPFYFGIDTLADASTENAEQFLQLARRLVDVAEVQLTRQRPPTLDASTQHRHLRQRARELLDQWSFPYFRQVRQLTAAIGARCVQTSLQPNAWLGPGANAYGVAQAEFEQIVQKHPELSRVLHFGIAYNAFTLVPDYECKNETWCLLELGGLAVVHHGLTLQRGGFIEGNVSELASMLVASPGAGA